MSNLYSYPIEITSEDIKNYTGIDITVELEESINAVDQFLNTVHTQVYDQVIYKATPKPIAIRLITANSNDLEADIKRALITQAEYLLANEGNIGTWNGAIKTNDGGTKIESSKNITSKIISEEVYRILEATHPKILFNTGVRE